MNGTFQTSDFYLASYLLSQGHQLTGLKRKTGRSEFVFDQKEDFKSITEAFYAMKTTVEPISYASAIRSLKAVLHAPYESINENENHECSTNQRSKR